MNQQRITLLPEPQFVALQPQLARRMDCAAKLLTPANFTSFCDGAMRRLIADTLHHCGATEGSIWLLDEKGQHLVNAFDHGPDAARLVGFRQPLKSGIISMVFATHQPFLENQVFQNAMHASAADKLTGHRTNAMIAVPLFFASDCRGVISAVQLVPAVKAAAGSPGFTAEHLARMQFTSELLSRLIDLKLLSLATGCGRD